MAFFMDGPDGPNVSLDYQAIRDLPHNEAHRAYIERLWARYRPSGDGDAQFLKEAKVHFLQRFWEMYLFCALEDYGTTVQKTMGASGGPDFSFEIGGTKYWMEATAPRAGDGNNRVPFPQIGIHSYVPRDSITLRYANALDTKFKNWLKWIDNKIVNTNDGCIIAVNGLGIPDADCGFDCPYILQSLFPVGPLAVNVDRVSLAVSEPYLLYEDTIRNQNGSPVNTAPFTDKNYSAVSAVMHSFAGFSSGALPLGYDFLLVHNPCAHYPLPDGSFPWCTQYRFEHGMFTRIDHDPKQLPVGVIDTA